MGKSKYTLEEKISILNEKELFNLTIEEICVKHKISLPTYYNWRREMENKEIPLISSTTDLKNENTTLRKLYTDLSEHNYKLAKFLNNQAQ